MVTTKKGLVPMGGGIGGRAGGAGYTRIGNFSFYCFVGQTTGEQMIWKERVTFLYFNLLIKE